MRPAAIDQILLDAMLSFVAEHDDPGVAPFKASMARWGNAWSAVRPSWLPAARHLFRAPRGSTPQTRELVGLFEAHREHLRWEQSYSKADGVVGDDMLSDYGFAEIIGNLGPFFSDRVRSGVGVWGPDITYPTHWHQAEEVYVVLAGSALFHVGGAGEIPRTAGQAVHVRPLAPHGFRTRGEPLVVFYVWQNGDLREKSTFHRPAPGP